MKCRNLIVPVFVSRWRLSPSRLFTHKPIPALVPARRQPEVPIQHSTQMSSFFQPGTASFSGSKLGFRRHYRRNRIGLGPTFNGNSCAQCHAQPTIGGASPGLISPQNAIQNPQVALATLDGASNSVPSFITANGPMLEARFIKTSTGALDGGVHDLYTIAGRSDASGCTLAQPDFATALSTNNVIFRTPTPLFGLGLVEATPDANLQANLAATASAQGCAENRRRLQHQRQRRHHHSLRLEGTEQVAADFCRERPITWSKEYRTKIFPMSAARYAGCVFNGSPEDCHQPAEPKCKQPNFGTKFGTESEMSSDVVNFAALFASQRRRRPPLPLSPLKMEPLCSAPSAAISATRRLSPPALRSSPACPMSPTTLIPTSLCTPWVPVWRTASIRARPVPTNSARRRSGGWASACSFFTMAALAI